MSTDIEILEKKLDELVTELAELKKMQVEEKLNKNGKHNLKPSQQTQTHTATEQKNINRIKQKVGVVGYGDNLRIGSGPAMSGIPNHYEMERTRTNKPIFSTPYKYWAKLQLNPDFNPPVEISKEPYHADFNGIDHRDAYYAHALKAKELKENPLKVNLALIDHHKDMAQQHWDAYQNSLSHNKKE